MKVEHRLEVCPCCAGPLQRCARTRTRIIEDIPREITPVVSEHTIHRDCRTLKLRGLDAIPTVVEALKHRLRTGTLPPLPAENAASG